MRRSLESVLFVEAVKANFLNFNAMFRLVLVEVDKLI